MWTESEWSRLLFQSCLCSSILGTKCHLLYVWHYTIIFRYDHVAVTQRYIQRYQLLSNQNTVNDLNSATETVVQHRVGVLTSCDVQTLRISDVWTTWAQQLYRQLTIIKCQTSSLTTSNQVFLNIKTTNILFQIISKETETYKKVFLETKRTEDLEFCWKTNTCFLFQADFNRIMWTADGSAVFSQGEATVWWLTSLD